MPDKHAIISMDCGHTLIFRTTSAPGLDELIWCARCHAVHAVRQAPTNYGWQCTTCRRGKDHLRGAKMTAQMLIDAHVKRRPTHTVHLCDGNRIIAIIAPQQSLDDVDPT